MNGAFTFPALATRWRRALLQAVTVALGVAMVTGALVFIDTTHSAYGQLFSTTSQGADMIIGPNQVYGTGVAPGITGAQTSAPASVPLALVHKIQKLQGVSAAAGRIVRSAEIIGNDGQPIRSGRLQTVALSDLPQPFTGITYSSGQPPSGPSEVAVDASTATQEHWLPGQQIKIVAGQPARKFTISGIVELGSATAGAQRFAVFSPGTARQLYSTGQNYDEIEVALQAGYSRAALTKRISRLLPPGLTVQGADGQVYAAVKRVGDAFSTLNAGLLAFALVAVLAGALVIFNSFAAAGAQRQKEFALLRALGATRRQAAASALTEALLTGVCGALLGAALGPLMALVIRAVMNSVGVDLPGGGLDVRWPPILIGIGVGVAVALLAALLPALRAGRAAPVEAMRESELPRTRAPLLGPLAGVALAAVLLVGGLVVVLLASGDHSRRLTQTGIGSALMLAGALVAGPLSVMLAGRVIGLVSGPRGRWRVWRHEVGPPRAGIIFELAREHTLTSVGRTALSASSLMIGVALVLGISVYSAGLRKTSSDAINQTIVGDVSIQSANGSDPIPPATVQGVASVPDLSAVSSLKTVTARLGNAGSVQVGGIDPTSWTHVYHFNWVSGSPQTVSGLSSGQALVEQDTAQAAGVVDGQHITLTGPTGKRMSLTVAGIYKDSGLLGGVVVPDTYFDQAFDQPQLQSIFVNLSGSVPRHVALAQLRQGLSRFPGVVVDDQHQLAQRLSANVTSVVDLLYALLVLAIVLSLLGIGGSLNLSVQARQRELGMLRALGMTPAQAGSLIRWESLLTAVIGGLTGFVLGLVMSAAGMHALGYSFAFPWLALLGALAAVLIAGFGAALAPAARAARVQMLAAIAYE
ncbi:MAG: ABC transporter permease [Solirubrobacterales bacterium]|nr:ABC transporter permease [Solirubrobacterales bacterium]